MNAKQAAIEDIKNELRQEGKSFLAFHSKLNPIMDRLVNNQIKKQLKKKH